MKHYYYIDSNHNQQGPVIVEQLRTLRITPTTLVWTEGMANWQQANTVDALSQLFSPPSCAKVNHVCPKCGRSYGSNNNFCVNCGTSLTSTLTPPSKQPQAYLRTKREAKRAEQDMKKINNPSGMAGLWITFLVLLVVVLALIVFNS